ncbi:MAG: hypothetical protein KME35_03665 [Aphanocapsa sp. GSE-SYN-MK-11-07L]|jgi:hypothetical protein|nr:hypothetical protein [Aphanocapsa sp. GSE-SYN-MK-11-07L]
MIKPAHYEETLAHYSDHLHAIELLRKYRPYLETVPSMRRPAESLITIPLPLVNVRRESPLGSTIHAPSEMLSLDCDLAFLMCDPEWRVKTDVEIFIFIHRSGEDFSDLLSRWRKTQIMLSRGYSWDMPLTYQHIFNDGAERHLPLFVLFEQTPDRIRRGMKGAQLPFIIESFEAEAELDVATAID